MNWKEIEVSFDQTFFHSQGSPLFGRFFQEVLKFHEPGIAPVKDESGAFHVDFNGRDLYPDRYERTFGFYCSRAAVVGQGDWFHLNTTGEIAYPERYQWVGNFQENLCPVRNQQGRYFHIQPDGQRSYKAEFLYAGDFKDGVACAKFENGLFRHIFKDGSLVHPFEFQDLGVYHKGFAMAKDSMGWFHIDRLGNQLYSQRYQLIEPFYNGFALVTSMNGLKKILDEKGVEILEV
jgi:hypothetical protein